ncbi:MAG: LytTR family DNA-binding domain-containing protein [Bacteroidota bacterium]
MITAIAIDDEPIALEIIKALSLRLEYLDLRASFTEASKAMNYLSENQVDLLFLDINMPAISGIDFYKNVPGNPMVIFTTAHSKYAAEGFDLNAVDYLVKPLEFPRFQKAVEKAREYRAYLQQKENGPQQHLFVKVDYSMVKVEIAEIIFIEGLDNYIKIHFTNGKSLLVRMSMKVIAEKLPDGFVRVHRSYIVPLSKVKAVRGKTIFLDNNEIPIGTNYAEDVQKLFKQI